MMLREAFPWLAACIHADLRKLTRSDLAGQVLTLQIVDRCRCGADACGAFNTNTSRETSRTRSGIDTTLPCGVVVSEFARTIIRIETLDSTVEAALRGLFP